MSTSSSSLSPAEGFSEIFQAPAYVPVWRAGSVSVRNFGIIAVDLNCFTTPSDRRLVKKSVAPLINPDIAENQQILWMYVIPENMRITSIPSDEYVRAWMKKLNEFATANYGSLLSMKVVLFGDAPALIYKEYGSLMPIVSAVCGKDGTLRVFQSEEKSVPEENSVSEFKASQILPNPFFSGEPTKTVAVVISSHSGNWDASFPLPEQADHYVVINVDEESLANINLRFGHVYWQVMCKIKEKRMTALVCIDDVPNFMCPLLGLGMNVAYHSPMCPGYRYAFYSQKKWTAV